MMIRVALALLAAGQAVEDRPRTYVASITGLQLKGDEKIDRFSISTWGVTFNAICRIPEGWTLTAGRRANPEGRLERQDLATADGLGVVPATFKGTATVMGSDAGRTISLTHANIRLAPANACPPVRTE